MTRAGRLRGASGFSVMEVLIALALAAMALSLIVSLTGALRSAMMTSGDRADLQQRARVVVESLASALGRAGAGADGLGVPGSLGRFLPPILPRGSSGLIVLGATGATPPARLAADLAAGAGAMSLEYSPGCPDPCGFFDGSLALVLDTHGDFDVFTIVDVAGPAATIQRHSAGTGASYPRGSPVLLADSRFYFLDRASAELRLSDGRGPSFAVAGSVSDVSFDYFGDAAPPALPAAAPGQENCLYDATGAPRGGLPTLPGNVATLTPLPLAGFGDGPWCGTGTNPFDADLLRVRAVRITARLYASSDALRGSAGPLFSVPGRARESALLLRDVTMRATIAPPNLARAAVH